MKAKLSLSALFILSLGMMYASYAFVPG